MSTYTPTTRQIEDFWASDGTEQPAAKSYDRAEGVAEFRRWLEQHDREATARAWDEGAEVAWANSTPQWNGHTHAPQFLPFCEANFDIDNPYKETK